MVDPRKPLIELAHRYLAALAAGQPEMVALAPNFRATENGRWIEVGKGLWETCSGVPGYPAFLCDEASGQVVVMGAIATDTLKPFALRLGIASGAVAEAEAIVSSSAHGFFADVDTLLFSDVLYEAPVPPERRASRSELHRVADSYWIALSESDGSLVAVDHRADRFANGKKVTNSLDILLSPDKAVHSIASLLTATRPARPQVREKRFPVLDTRRGVAATFAIVDFADDPRNPRPDTGSFYILNVVKVVDGRIRIIDALHEICPRGTTSGWAENSG